MAFGLLHQTLLKTQSLVMLGLILIQAEFLSIMMDTGLRLEQPRLVQQDLLEHPVHKVRLVLLVPQDQQVQLQQLQDLLVQLEPQGLQDLLVQAAVGEI
jgi:hypothetical protein